MKERTGGDIGVHGSITLTQSLLAAGLVDELRLVVAPVVQGQGRKLFEGNTSSRLTLTRSIASPTGSLLLDFHVEN
jgi:dihydrofolate reductase